MKAFTVIFSLLFAITAIAEEKKLGLKHESTLSYVQTAGNSEATTTSFKQMTGYWWTMDVLKLTGHYLSTNTTDKTVNPNKEAITAENWSAALRYEKVLTPDRFNVYASHGWRGDRFQNIQQGHDSDVGGKYFWIKDDKTAFSSELGYRYTKELLTSVIVDPENPKNGQGHPEYHFLRLAAQFDQKCTESFAYGLSLEYLPSFDNFEKDYRFNFNPYITSTLSDMFSLKVAYEGKYRNIPAQSGLERLDTIFTTSIIAKY